MKKIFLSVAIATIAASAVQAQQAGDPFKNTEEGWFWYQVDPEPKETLKVEEVPRSRISKPPQYQLGKPRSQKRYRWIGSRLSTRVCSTMRWTTLQMRMSRRTAMPRG